jgi:gamma-glutamyltranspeptidase/glutathione hydrolase
MADPKTVKLADTDATGRPMTGRPVVSGTHGVISSGHPLTSMAGMRMLLAGGNAFDAMVAAVFAAAVIEPIASYSLGAESVFMLHDASSGDLRSISGQGVAPGRATADFYRDKGLDSIPTGPGPLAPLSFTVPGVVHAALSILEQYGTKSALEVLAPSIEYAETGIPHYQYMVDALNSKSTREQFDQFPPGGTGVFYEDGALPEVGSMLVQPGLARTLKAMVSASDGAGGDREAGLRAARVEFYEGGVGRAMADASKGVGGILELDDLANYSSDFETPLATEFAGYTIHAQSTWSQGAVLLQALNILEHFDLQSLGHNTPEYIHVVSEALKLALADREAHYGDPDFVAVPIDGLLSKEYAASRAAMIDMGRAQPGLPPAGDPWKFSATSRPGAMAPAPEGTSERPKKEREQGTTHISVADSDGNLACATPSGGSFGKSVFFPELGFALSTRSEMFNLQEGHPNVVEPRKRPRTTLVNYIAAKDGEPVITFGCPGGDHQPQGNLQILLNTLVFGMDPQEAIEEARFATDSAMNSFFPHATLPGQLSVEEGISSSTVDVLSDMGHTVVRSDVCGMGATVTRRDIGNGVLSTGADPRRACYALSW